MIKKKNINKTFSIFIFFHLFLWTLIPSISNLNLPLDTIEALAWGSNLDWGYNKHPPVSAFAVEFFFKIFGNNDWAYYLLSQIFVITSFYFVWKFSNKIFEDKIVSLLSVLILSGIYFYNFTTPEFNVNISQLPFWALSVYFFWKGLNSNNKIDWILFGIFSALGFLSKYLFIYILLALLIFFMFKISIDRNLLGFFITGAEVVDASLTTKHLKFIPLITFMFSLISSISFLSDSQSLYTGIKIIIFFIFFFLSCNNQLVLLFQTHQGISL